MRAVFVGLVVVLAGAAPTADPVPLRWKLAKGDQFFVRSVQEMQQTIGVLGMNMEQSSTTTTVSRYKVLEAGADGMTVESTITKTDIVSNVPMAAEQAGRMKGATLTFKLGKDMKVTEVVGYDKFLEQIAGGNEDQAKVMRAAASEDALKVAVEDLFNPGPGNPVKPGDKWTRDTKMSLGPLGNFAINARYTLDSLDGPAAKVSYEADAAFTAAKGGGDLPFSISKGELKADTYTGSLVFDTAAGRLKESAQNVKLGGALTVAAAGNEIEMTFSQTLKVTGTVSDKEPAD